MFSLYYYLEAGAYSTKIIIFIPLVSVFVYPETDNEVFIQGDNDGFLSTSYSTHLA
jgi:hypothetical protein